MNEGIVSTASKLSTDGHMTWKVGEQLPSVSLAEPGPTGSAGTFLIVCIAIEHMLNPVIILLYYFLADVDT